MSSYSELIKNFERIRAYMREFYVYGFKSRDEYAQKSARSYDDERRRMESWLGEHMRFIRTAEGKNMFISIDSRAVKRNPLYNAWKTKSFTDGDITLHFILFDILHKAGETYSLAEIMDRIAGWYLAKVDTPLAFDESTVRKKLKEYVELGLISTEKQGRKTLYKRVESPNISALGDVLDYFSEVAPCGVIGSFLLDKKQTDGAGAFSFKHHYITGTLDSGVLAALFTAMREKSVITVSSRVRKKNEPSRIRVIPLRVLISVQSGRQHLLAYQPDCDGMKALRIDSLSNVKIEEQTPRFDELRQWLDDMKPMTWGINTASSSIREKPLERVEFTIVVAPYEEHIYRRLLREKRVGKVKKIDERTYRFSAKVYDSNELLPWLRTFICRITDIKFSNTTVERRFKQDLLEMYRMYGLNGEE